jgi:hypothetical protein
MIKEKDTTGWATAIFIIIFALIASYFVILSPARQQADDLRKRAETWEQRANNTKARELPADQQTLNLVAEARGLTSTRLVSELQRLGIPNKNISSTPGSVTVEAVGSIDQVASWISLTSGRAYLNDSAQIRGSGSSAAEAQYRIKALGGRDQYLLTIELQTLSRQ